MINEEIKKILGSGKDIQMQVLELQKLGRLVYDELNKPPFQEAYKQSTEGLQSKIDAIKQDYAKVETELKQNEALLSQKEKLEKDFQELQLKQKQLTELKEKNRILNLPENAPSKISSDISKFFGTKEDLIKKHIETLQKLNDVLANANTDLEKQLISKLNEAETNLNAIQEKQVDALSKLDTTPIQSMFLDFGNEVNRLVEEFNTYADKINTIKNDLEEISIKHDGVIETFKAHQLENKLIYGALEDKEGVKTHVNLLSREIEERLLKFDTEINEIVKRRNELPIYKLEETKKYQS